MYQLVTFLALSGLALSTVGAARHVSTGFRSRGRRRELASPVEAHHMAALIEARARWVPAPRTTRSATRTVPPSRVERTSSTVASRIRDRTGRTPFTPDP